MMTEKMLCPCGCGWVWCGACQSFYPPESSHALLAESAARKSQDSEASS